MLLCNYCTLKIILRKRRLFADSYKYLKFPRMNTMTTFFLVIVGIVFLGIAYWFFYSDKPLFGLTIAMIGILLIFAAGDISTGEPSFFQIPTGNYLVISAKKNNDTWLVVLDSGKKREEKHIVRLYCLPFDLVEQQVGEPKLIVSRQNGISRVTLYLPATASEDTVQVSTSTKKEIP